MNDRIMVLGHLTCWGGRSDKAHVISPDGICECITAEAGKGFPPKIMERDKMKAALTPRRNEFGRRIRKKYESPEVKLCRHLMRDYVPRNDGICNTLTGVLKDNYIAEGMDTLQQTDIIEGLRERRFRIRKLTPRECFRLMGVRETDIDKIQNTKFRKNCLVPSEDQDGTTAISKPQQYRMAGNSIVTDCLFYIFRNLFVGIPDDEKDTLF